MNALTLGGVVDRIHGVDVRDPYRWLEDRSSGRTQEWIHRQNQLCESYYLKNRFYRGLRNVVSETLSVEVTDQAARVGNNIFLRKQRAGQEQAAIWVQSPKDDEDRLLVDPSTFGSNVAVGIVRLSADGSLLAYSIRSSGSDLMEIRIVDVATGKTLPDRLPSAYLRGFGFESQGNGFYYCIEPHGRNDDPSIKHHRFGQGSDKDVTLFSIPWAEHRRLVLLSNRVSLAAMITEVQGSNTLQDLYIATDSCHWSPVFQGARGRRSPLLAHGRLFLLDMEDARNGRLLELPNGESPARIVVPECQDRIQKCLEIQGGFLISYMVDRQIRLERWSVEGNSIGPVTLPPGGAIELLPSYLERPSSVFFLHESYTEAPSLWEIELSSKPSPKTTAHTISNEQTVATVREYWYPSFDGTMIPIMLIEPPEESNPTPRPVVLFGYGGFGATEVPRYSRLAKLLVELKVTIARPAIRGGSEFGEEWHQAATRRRKQVSIDDFLAAARWMISEGMTDSQHLAIMGSSNGGLLVTAAITQRPDSFKAAVCSGPLTDMVRYESFDYASRWRNEYGTVEDADDFKALFAYSPYHNVKEGKEYPAVLLVTGDADDRCNPAHARKMTAVLQDLSDGQNAIVLDYSDGWGHVPTLGLSERVVALTRKIAFLCEELGLTMPGGDADERFSV